MKLEAKNLGPSVAAACALVLAPVACDNGGGDSGSSAGGTMSGTGGDGSGGDSGSNGSSGNGDGSGADATGTGGADGTAGTSDSGKPGMGEDPPTFDCSKATKTLDKKFFTISADEYDDTKMLDGINKIDGHVTVDTSNYNNLDMLACVTEITGDLKIFGNPFLVDVSGLNALETLGGNYGGDFVFSSNDAIEDFNGLAKLQQIATSPDPMTGKDIYHSLVMNDNGAMTQISGFDSLVAVFGNITIRDNASLQNIDGLQGLLAVGLTLAITHNPMLCQSSINSVGGQIQQPCIVGPPACDPQVPPPDSWTTQANNSGC